MRYRMLDSPTDWIIFIVVVLVILGGSKKIPELAKSLGRAMGEFRKGRLEVEKEINEAMKAENNVETKQ
ncbi:MAG: twin-arginine translocase TatA/TatE family subunit [Thermoplasmatales archaeon]